MRSRLGNALMLTTTMLVGIAWSGCTAKKQTEYVTGVSTQVTVPRDMKAITVGVSVGGVPVICNAYAVYNGKVQLPRSLGEFPASGTSDGQPITVTVTGLTDAFDDTSSNPVYVDCVGTAPEVGQNSARILRRSRQPYVQDNIMFLPMPLKFSCYDTDCGQDEGTTCKAGVCGTSTTDETTLPRYTDDLLNGTGAACFSASLCFAAAVPPVVVDPDKCIYALPNTPSAPPVRAGITPQFISSQGDGINVEVTYDAGFTDEILDKDPDEGFTVPDPTKPQQFQLTAGLCNLVKGTPQAGMTTPSVHRITEIRATGSCQAKAKLMPLCADDMDNAMGTPGGVSPNPTAGPCISTSLTPSKSVLIVLADDSTNNEIFYTGGNTGVGASSETQSDLVSQALGDPSFTSTFVGLQYFPGSATAQCTPVHSLTTTLAPAPATLDATKEAFTSSFSTIKNSPSTLLFGPDSDPGIDLNLTGALNDAYATLAGGAYADAHRRAVLVLSNREFGVNSCGGIPADAAAAAYAANQTNTYVAIFSRDFAGPPLMATYPADPDANLIAQKGDPVAGADAHAFDARGTDSNSQAAATDALRKIVNDLATCSYDIKIGQQPPPITDVLSYSDPFAYGTEPRFYSINHDAACTSDTATANGWGYVAPTSAAAPGRVVICGQACTDYRNRLSTAAAYNAQSVLDDTTQNPSPAIPLFDFTAGCQPH